MQCSDQRQKTPTRKSALYSMPGIDAVPSLVVASWTARSSKQKKSRHCAVAFAGLHDLPDTIASRAILIHMRKRTAKEPIEPFRSRTHKKAGHALRDRIAAWAAKIAPSV